MVTGGLSGPPAAVPVVDPFEQMALICLQFSQDRRRRAPTRLKLSDCGSEVATGGSELGGVQQLWDAPYHRLGLMHPNATNIGWGHSELNGRQSNVGDIVYDFGFRAVDFVRSPANLQTNIPTTWSGHESPSLVPAGSSGPYGYPIMVVYSAGTNVQMRAAEVVAPDGTRLPIYYAQQQFEYDYQVIVPQRPLAANTTYHVRFDITVGGERMGLRHGQHRERRRPDVDGHR